MGRTHWAESTAPSDQECGRGGKKPQFKGKECCPVSGQITVDWKDDPNNGSSS